MAAVYLAQDLKHRRPEHDAAVREGERGLALIKDHRRSEEWFQRITGKPTSSP
jgi:hypothetical protein